MPTLTYPDQPFWGVRLWVWFRNTDQRLHKYVFDKLPNAMRATDRALEALFALVSHGAFALLCALLLTVLAVTNRIPLIVAISLGGAWFIAMFWLARLGAIKGLTILSRWVVILAGGAVFAIVANFFGTWALEITTADVRFKDAPEFTWWRKQVITHDTYKLRTYLADFDMPQPRQLPPFEIDKSGKGECGQSGSIGPSYLSEMRIGAKFVGDRKMATCAYLDYLVGSMVTMTVNRQPTKPSTSALDFIKNTQKYFICAMAIQTYLNDSYWDAPSPSPTIKLGGAFWQIRTKLGKNKTDRIIIYALRTMVDKPEEYRDEALDAYVRDKLREADRLVNGDYSQWPEITKALEDNGYH